MPLPLPNLPPGCVQVTFQANLPDYPATVKILHPRIAAKLFKYYKEAYHLEDGVGKIGFASLTDLFHHVLDLYLLTAADAMFPDPPDRDIVDLEAQLAVLKDAAAVRFI